PAVVHVNRLHILQRFHDYLAELEQEPETVSARFTLYADLLLGAYQDFVNSDARTEKVFRVFQRQDPPHAEIQLNDLMSQLPPKSATTNNPSATDPDAP
ncbi:MAG TPA: hypothetical protein DDY14_04840, partial [Chromatiaceae bacterium]|nr:hypothetical protein [Chromatiaceae bacterium]